MFDISFFEIMIISVVGLIVIGPERLPQVARTLGHLIGRCRQLVYSIKTDIHNELRMEELKNMHNSMQETAHTIENTLRQEMDDIKSTTQLNTESVTAKADTNPETKPLAESIEKKDDATSDQPKPPIHDKTPSQ